MDSSPDQQTARNQLRGLQDGKLEILAHRGRPFRRPQNVFSTRNEPVSNEIENMATKLRVECIKKTGRHDAHERIKAVGGGSPGRIWKYTQEDAITWIEDGTFEYYVINKEGKEISVIVARRQYGHKYLKTEADGEQPDNLLNLPECL